MGKTSIAAATAALLLCVAPAAASADDLIALAFSPAVELSGSSTYGTVYIDTELRLEGDVTIHARTVYVGPNARIRTCYVASVDDDACTAGRSLTVATSGDLTIAPNLDLTAASGPTGASRPGGSLTITSGGSLTLGGSIDATGSAAPSGAVSLSAARRLAIRDVAAPGSAIHLQGAQVTVDGDLRVGGDAGTLPAPASVAPAGGTITILATGAVRLGAVDVSGERGGSDGGGGAGGSLTIHGGDVRAFQVDADGGSTDVTSGGAGGAVLVVADGPVTISTYLSVSGASSNVGDGPAAGPIAITAAGDVSVGAIGGAGGNGATVGGAGSSIALAGDAVAVDRIYAGGGDAATSGAGGRGATVEVLAGGVATLGDLYLGGGRGATGSGGVGGTLAVRAGAAMVGQVYADGGAPGDGHAGSTGGSISVVGRDGVTLTGGLYASGSDAADGSAASGGAGGPVTLLALGGAVTGAGLVITTGGRGGSGSPSGAPGATGGTVDVAARDRAELTGIYTYGGGGGGGDAGNAAGGAGGRIRWFGQGDLFNGERFVTTEGGYGEPQGPAGVQEVNGAPTALARGARRVVFTGHAPSATGNEVVVSLAGGPYRRVAAASAGSGAWPGGDTCLAGRVAVVARNAALGWTSAASGALVLAARDRAAPACQGAPRVTVRSRSVSLAALRRDAFEAPLAVVVAGSGFLRVEVVSADQSAIVIGRLPVGPGRLSGVSFALPRWALSARHLTLRVTARAARGRAVRVTTVRYTVRRS